MYTGGTSEDIEVGFSILKSRREFEMRGWKVFIDVVVVVVAVAVR